MSQPIRSQGGHLVLPIGPKNTNLVEDVEIFLPDKFLFFFFNVFICTDIFMLDILQICSNIFATAQF